MDPETGILSGFPLETKNYTFTILARDSRDLPRYAMKSFSLRSRKPVAKINLSLNQELYSGGDTMNVELKLESRAEEPVSAGMLILIDVSGYFMFLDYYQGQWPAFSQDPVILPLQMDPEFLFEEEILAIFLPPGLTSFSGSWYGALISQENGTALGPVSIIPFEYTP